MKNSKPISHHYIPQFILKKFGDNNGEIHSFNKKHWKPNKPTKSTKYIFSENNLHTLISGNDEFYEIEKLYAGLEDNFSGILNLFEQSLRQGSNLKELNSLETDKIIGFFVSLSFWRLPSASNLARSARTGLRKIYDSAGIENKKLLNRDRKFIRDLERKGGDASEKICQFLVMPILTANLEENIEGKIWFHETNFDLVMSDRPVICEMDKNSKISGAFYMPISPRLCLTNQPNFIEKFNNQVFLNAKEIVIGCSKSSLEKCLVDNQACLDT